LYLFLSAYYKRKEQYSRAVRCAKKVLVIDPDNIKALYQIADISFELGHYRRAAVYYNAVLQKDDSQLEARHQCGLSYWRLGRLKKAKNKLIMFITSGKATTEIYRDIASIYRQQGALDASTMILQECLKKTENNCYCVSDLARGYFLDGDTEKALEIMSKHHSSCNDVIQYILLYIDILRNTGSWDKAIQIGNSIDNKDPDVLIALAGVMKDSGDNLKAEEHLDKVLAKTPGHPNTMYHKSLIQLAHGQYDTGWHGYLYRKQTHENPVRSFGDLEACDKNIKGKHVLAYAEQGLGDEIMFASCLSDLIEVAASCTIECNPKLTTLYSRSFPEARVIPCQSRSRITDRPFTDLDCAIPVGDLPSFFRKSRNDFPGHYPYLLADEIKSANFRKLISEKSDLKWIGLAWRGGLPQTRSQLRSLDLKNFEQLLKNDKLGFVILQRDMSHEERETITSFCDNRIHFLDQAEFSDMDTLAASISAVSCVITPQCYLAHLAGALGVDTKVLLSTSAEWRYGTINETMDWYPSVSLFRQHTKGDWQSPIEKLTQHITC